MEKKRESKRDITCGSLSRIHAPTFYELADEFERVICQEVADISIIVLDELREYCASYFLDMTLQDYVDLAHELYDGFNRKTTVLQIRDYRYRSGLFERIDLIMTVPSVGSSIFMKLIIEADRRLAITNILFDYDLPKRRDARNVTSVSIIGEYYDKRCWLFPKKLKLVHKIFPFKRVEYLRVVDTLALWLGREKAKILLRGIIGELMESIRPALTR